MQKYIAYCQIANCQIVNRNFKIVIHIMVISHEFEYIKPTTLNEVTDSLSKHGDKARILSGGTDLTVRLKEDIETPDIVIDIKGISELNRFKFANNELTIGAGVTFSDIIASAEIKKSFYMLWEAATTVASVGTRNRATLVGNICSAVPSLDSGPALLCYDAKVLVKSKTGERVISIHDWFIGPKKTALKKDELVTDIVIPQLTIKNGACYMKLGRYAGEDLAQAGVGVIVSADLNYHIAYCAVGPVPKRSWQIEALLKGKNPDKNLIQEAQKIAVSETSPITDIRASKEYRSHMISVMLERGLRIAADRLE